MTTKNLLSLEWPWNGQQTFGVVNDERLVLYISFICSATTAVLIQSSERVVVFKRDTMNIRWMGSLDMYRKVPTDLMEGTRRGSYLSLIALTTMMTLFLLETRAFLRTE